MLLPCSTARRAAERPRTGSAAIAGQRLSNREIADELVVALDTVKKHVRHIFAKPGASSRTQMAARARELDLL